MPRVLLGFAWLLLLIHPTAVSFQMEPQAIRERLEAPEFAKTLKEILAAVKIGTVPQINPETGVQIGPPIPAAFVGITSSHEPLLAAPPNFILPAAGFCFFSQVSYRCDWETKPNKYSVAVLQDYISASVASALPKTWNPTKGETDTVRYTDFNDPAGKIVIRVSCPISNGDLPVRNWVASLTIESAELRRLQ